MAPKTIEPVDLAVGNRIRSRRQLLGMSQTKLGLQLGVTFQQVQKYENGTNRVSGSRLQQIADVLGLLIPDFFDLGTPVTVSDDRAEIKAIEAASAFLSTDYGARLARAFEKVSDPKMRRMLVILIEAIGETESQGRT